MKKILLLGLLLFAILNPYVAFAQKKSKKDKKNKKAKVEAVAQPVIQTEADTLSYALGLTLPEGLSQYLQQIEVLSDTVGLKGDSLESVKFENERNLSLFLDGFNAGINSEKDQKAYNSGLSIANQLLGMTKKFSEEVIGDEGKFNIGAFASAFTSSMKKELPLIAIDNPGDMIEAKAQSRQQERELKAQEAEKVKYADKIAEGDKFMQENKTKDGVVSLPSGLQYKVLTAGTGRIPVANDRVKVHYHGSLLDGTVFDSSVDRGEPVEFNVGQLIRGFNEALLLMPEGSKWIVYIPYDLAYGGANQGVISPFSNLIFEIELLKVGSDDVE